MTTTDNTPCPLKSRARQSGERSAFAKARGISQVRYSQYLEGRDAPIGEIIVVTVVHKSVLLSIKECTNSTTKDYDFKSDFHIVCLTANGKP